MAKHFGSKERGERYRVLLVDDDPQILSVLETRFTAENFKVQTANDGRTAWWMIQQNRPDVVVSDYAMPYMDGQELLSTVRSHERFRDLAFIIVTASGDTDQLVETLQIGADDYVMKPLALDELIARVYKVLRSRNREAGLQGDLAQFSLPDLLQILAQNRRTGCLEVAIEKQQFVLRFQEGKLIGALAQPANVRGSKAFYRVLYYDQGDFYFRPFLAEEGEQKGEEKEEFLPIDFLLMEGMRQRDELARFLDNLGVEYPQFVRSVREFPLELSGSEQEVLRVMDVLHRRYRLQAVMDAVIHLTDLDVALALESLVERGLLRVEEGEPDAAKEDSTEFIKRGRGVPPLMMIGSPAFEALVTALMSADQELAFSAIEGAISGGVPAAVIYRKVLVGAVQEFAARLERMKAIPPDLARLSHILERLLERVGPLLGAPPPVQATVVLGRPVGESGSMQMIATFLRASGFGVIDLGSRVTPSAFYQTVISSGASLLCLMVRTDNGVQIVRQLRNLLDERGMRRIQLIVGGPPFDRDPVLMERVGAAARAMDAMDVIRKVHELLNLPLGIQPPSTKTPASGVSS